MSKRTHFFWIAINCLLILLALMSYRQLRRTIKIISLEAKCDSLSTENLRLSWDAEMLCQVLEKEAGLTKPCTLIFVRPEEAVDFYRFKKSFGER